MSLFKSVADTSSYIVKLLIDFIPVNTVFIATNDGKNNTILKSYNRDEQIIQEGDILPLVETYCSLVVDEPRLSVVIIPDTMADPIASKLDITKKLGSCSFVGVPILVRNKGTYGTICAIDRVKRDYSEKEISLLETMAKLIGNVIELENASITDSLTGFYNRKYLDRLRHTQDDDPSARHLSFIFIDIDDFKQINDTYGHDIGDVVLLEVAKRLKATLRKSDTIIRMGGDEFVVMVEVTKDEQELHVVAEKVLSIMKEPLQIDGEWIGVSISVGISRGELSHTSIRQLIKNADQAMYEVKHQGKGNYKISL